MTRASAVRRLRVWAPVAALLAFEFFVSSRPRLPSLPLDLPSSDKLAHAGYFFLTGLFAARAAHREGWGRAATYLALVGGTLLWGVTDEWHQSFVPGRDVEALDVVADVGGAALAALAFDRIGVVRRVLAGGQGFEPR